MVTSLYGSGGGGRSRSSSTLLLVWIVGLLAGLGLTGVEWSSTPGVGAAATSGAVYSALPPTRILDTRASLGPLGPQKTLSLQVAGLRGVPAGATAVALNVTVTDTTAPSYLSVYPAGGSVPLISNLNWIAGETRANLVVVSVGSQDSVDFYNASGDVDVVVDLQGYFSTFAGSPSGEYVPLSPHRIADTRPGSGQPYSGDTLGPGQSLDVQVTGAGGVPSTGVAAAVVNVTVTDTTAASFLSVYPKGEANPGTSTVNWPPGLTVANRVMVPVGSGGEITVFNLAGKTDVVVDVDGYFAAGAAPTSAASLFYPVGPTRVLDTRANAGTLGPATVLAERFSGLSGVAEGASAIVANLTATDTSAASFFTLSPSGGAPQTSDLNWAEGMTVAELAFPMLNTSGDLSLFNAQGSADAVVDLFGYFAPVTGGSSSGAPPCTGATLTAPSQSEIGSLLSVTARATCPPGTTAYLTYWFRGPGSVQWTLAQAASTGATYSYPTTGWSAGTYQFLVWVSSESGVYQQLSGAATTVLIPPPCSAVTINLSPDPGILSLPIVITATPQCPAGVTAYYEYFFQPSGATTAPTELGNGWTSQGTFEADTEGWAPGGYLFSVSISSMPSGSAQAQASAQDSLQASGTIVVPNVPYSPQYYGEDCEEAALEMALAKEGLMLQGNNIQSQNDILAAEGVDWHVPGIGPSYTSGDPMQNFIGPPTGPQSSAYEPGAYYGAIVKAAVHFGGVILAAGEGITPTQVYAYVEEGHTVQTWVSFDFQFHSSVTLTNGQDSWPWAGPYEHSVLVVGVGVNEVLIDNPWPTATRGAAYPGQDQWVPMAVFEAAYSTYGDMAVALS